MVDTGPAWVVAGSALEGVSVGDSTGRAGSVAGTSMEEEAILAVETLVWGGTSVTVAWASNTFGA